MKLCLKTMFPPLILPRMGRCNGLAVSKFPSDVPFPQSLCFFVVSLCGPQPAVDVPCLFTPLIVDTPTGLRKTHNHSRPRSVT